MYKNRPCSILLAMLVALAALSSRARAETIANVSTGFAPLIPWTFHQGATTGFAQGVSPSSPDWYGGWLANDSASQWIAINANNPSNGPAGYSFTRDFNLTGYDLSTVTLSGGWTIDDQGTLALNGHQIIASQNVTLGNGQGPWTALIPFSIPTSDLNQGINTLTITMTATDNVLDAVRLQGTVSGTLLPPPPPPVSLEDANAAPLPSTAWAGLGLLGGMLAVQFRRKRAAV